MKIIVPLTTSKDGVTFYRLTQPLEYLKSKGHEIVFIPEFYDEHKKVTDKSIREIMNVLQDADYLWLISPCSMSFLDCVANIIKQNLAEQVLIQHETPLADMRKEGLSTKPLKIVVDFDDDLFEMNPVNPAYLLYGRKEVIVSGKEKRYLWRVGQQYRDLTGVQHKFSILNNKERLFSKLEFLKLADFMTTPSILIAKRYKRFLQNGKALLLPNAIDSRYFKPCKSSTDGKIRIIWTISASHLPDWCAIYPAIGAVMQKYPQVELITVGSKFTSASRAIPLSRWKHYNWVADVREYGKFMSGLTADIGIAHVINDGFNKYKSPLKACEYMALGLAPIVSNHLYGNYLDEKSGVMAYNDIEDFKAKFEWLINNPRILKDNREKARNFYYNNYSLETVGDNLEKCLVEACK